MTKDGILSLLAYLGQSSDVLAPTGPSSTRASMVSLLVCPESGHSSLGKHDWVFLDVLLINFSIPHHVSVIPTACGFLRQNLIKPIPKIG
jgi:hypothetical protein